MGFIHRIVAVGSATIIGAGAALVAVAPASAVGAADWAGFTSAFAGSSTGIELSGDVTGTGSTSLPAGKTLTLDLNGHALTVTGTAGNAGLGVPSTATLIITDTSAAGTGVLTVTGGSNAAAIGGGNRVASGAIRIQGGTVVAKPGGAYSAGIGAGSGAAAGPITISGGTVTATAGNYAAAIGGADSASAGAVTISGGTVTATGGAYGAGIGGGSGGTGGTVSITGGTVSATGGNYGPGIGTAWHGSFGSVSITGGTVTATGGDRSAGIGGGFQTAGMPISIGAGASVTAVGGGSGISAIGAEAGYDFGSLTVGGTLTLPAGSRLTVPAGVTIAVPGSLVTSGTVDLSGTLTGTVANHGTIIVRDGGAVTTPALVSDHNYVVTFDPADGTATTQARVYATTFNAGVVPAPATPTRTGYTFAGWYTAPTGGTAWTTASTLTADATVTARWNRVIVPFTAPAAATLAGDARVGSTLTAQVTTPAAPTPESYAYQWLADGAVIGGATAATYVPTADVLGLPITVIVSPVKDGYDSASGATETDPTAAVASGSFRTAPTVEIQGTPVAGGTLTAAITAQAAPTPTGYTYKWYADGEPIDGATLATLVLTRDFVGAEITVEALPSLDGYTASTGAGSSAATLPVAGQPFGGFLGVTVTGTAQVGRTLTAAVEDGLEPFATAFGYAWYADGVLLQDGPSRSVTLDRVAAGAHVTVTATATAPGYAPVSVTSQPLTVAPAPTLTLSSASVAAGTRVTVTGEHFIADPSVTLELHSDVVVVGVVEPAADGTFRSTFTVGAGVPAGTHHIVAVDPDGRELASVTLTVTAAAPAGAALASTGSETPVPAALTAVLFVLAGLVLAVRARRRSARA